MESNSVGSTIVTYKKTKWQFLKITPNNIRLLVTTFVGKCQPGKCFMKKCLKSGNSNFYGSICSVSKTREAIGPFWGKFSILQKCINKLKRWKHKKSRWPPWNGASICQVILKREEFWLSLQWLMRRNLQFIKRLNKISIILSRKHSLFFVLFSKETPKK